MGKMNEDPLRAGSANLVFFIGRAAIGAKRKPGREAGSFRLAP